MTPGALSLREEVGSRLTPSSPPKIADDASREIGESQGGAPRRREPALRLTRYFCRRGLEQPAAAMRRFRWSSELGTRRMGSASTLACVSVACRPRRRLARGSLSAVKIRRCSPPVALVDSRNRSPAEQVNSAVRFLRTGDPEYPRHPAGCLATTRSVGSRPNRSISPTISRWEGPQMLAFTHVEGCQWGREPLFPYP